MLLMQSLQSAATPLCDVLCMRCATACIPHVSEFPCPPCHLQIHQTVTISHRPSRTKKFRGHAVGPTRSRRHHTDNLRVGPSYRRQLHPREPLDFAKRRTTPPHPAELLPHFCNKRVLCSSDRHGQEQTLQPTGPASHGI